MNRSPLGSRSNFVDGIVDTLGFGSNFRAGYTGRIDLVCSFVAGTWVGANSFAAVVVAAVVVVAGWVVGRVEKLGAFYSQVSVDCTRCSNYTVVGPPAAAIVGTAEPVIKKLYIIDKLIRSFLLNECHDRAVTN